MDNGLFLFATDWNDLDRAAIVEPFQYCREACPEPFEEPDSHSVIKRNTHFLAISPITNDIDEPRTIVMLNYPHEDNLAPVTKGFFYVAPQQS